MSEPITNLTDAVRELGALPVPLGTKPEPMDRERLAEIEESHPGDWYAGEWRSEMYTAGGFSEYLVKHVSSDTVLAELPDWAAGLALFFADAHDAVPELVAEVRRARTRITELEAAPPTVYRAQHDSIVMGYYATRQAAYEHCEAYELRDDPASPMSWNVDEDGVAELVRLRVPRCPAESPTGYVVTPVEVSTEYDAEADE